MTPPALGLMYLKSALSSDDAREFQKLVAPEGQELHLIERDDAETYAGLEWLMPTAVIVFIGKAYFDGLLKEMGKDHYALLKKGIKSLQAKLFGPGATQYSMTGTAGKVQADRLYSLTFSMLAEGQEGISFKLLLPYSGDQAGYDAAVKAFLDFLSAYHCGKLDTTVIAELEAIRIVGRTVLLAYEPALKRLQPVNPLRDVR